MQDKTVHSWLSIGLPDLFMPSNLSMQCWATRFASSTCDALMLPMYAYYYFCFFFFFVLIAIVVHNANTMRCDRRLRAEHMIFVNIVRLSLTLAVQEKITKRRQKRFTRCSMRREQRQQKKVNKYSFKHMATTADTPNQIVFIVFVKFWANSPLPPISLCVDGTDVNAAKFNFALDSQVFRHNRAQSHCSMYERFGLN